MWEVLWYCCNHILYYFLVTSLIFKPITPLLSSVNPSLEIFWTRACSLYVTVALNPGPGLTPGPSYTSLSSLWHLSFPCESFWDWVLDSRTLQRSEICTTCLSTPGLFHIKHSTPDTCMLLPSFLRSESIIFHLYNSFFKLIRPLLDF